MATENGKRIYAPGGVNLTQRRISCIWCGESMVFLDRGLWSFDSGGESLEIGVEIWYCSVCKKSMHVEYES